MIQDHFFWSKSSVVRIGFRVDLRRIIWLQKIRCGFVWSCKMFGLESSFPQVSCTSICMWGEACVNINEWYHFLDFAYIQFSWPCLYTFLQWLKYKVVPLCPAKKLFLPFKCLSLAPWRTASRSPSPWHLWGGLAPPEAHANLRWQVALGTRRIGRTTASLQNGARRCCFVRLPRELDGSERLARDGLHQCISNMVAFRVGPVQCFLHQFASGNHRELLATLWLHAHEASIAILDCRGVVLRCPSWEVVYPPFDLFAGVLNWGYPDNWMVYFMENRFKMDLKWWYPHFLGNLSY